MSWDDLSRHLVEDPVKAARKASHMLLGCLVSKRIQYRSAVSEAIRAAWSFAHDMQIHEVGPKKYFFSFF